jgi:hypothetical protein
MSKFKLGVLVGVGLGLIIAAVLAVWLLRDPIPPLTRSAYEEAAARWRRKNPQDYDMHLVFSGAQVEEFDVRVRSGEVTQLVRDGQALTKRGTTWRNWTVPGLFEILETDLARMENPDADAVDVKISAEFDADWGLPSRYRQIQLGGARQSSEWQVTEFRAHPAD